MTISSETRKAGPFTGNGATDAFPFTFKVFANADVQVVVADADAVESVLVLDTDYSISLNADQDASPGGTITLLAGALTTGYKLVIIGAIENLQGTDLTNQGGFYPQTIEDMVDRATIQIQQLAEGLDRSIKVPATSDVELAELTEDLIRVAESIDNIDAVAANESNINAVVANASNIDAVAANETNIDAVAANEVNIDAVAANEANINAAVANATNINAAVANATNINAVAANEVNIDAVADNEADIDTVAANIADINTVADNIADVTNFADIYQGPKATPPTLRNNGDALVAGDLYFDTVAESLYAWTGSVWEATTITNSIVRSASVATAAQTVITTPLYTPGSNNLALYVNGVKMQLTLDYTETDQTTVTMTSGLTVDDNIEVLINRSVMLGASLSNIVFADTYDDTGTTAVSLAVDLPDGATVIVDRDETNGNLRTRYSVSSGVPVSPITMGTRGWSIPTIAVLKTISGSVDGDSAFVTSYYDGWAATASGPQGGGRFIWDSASTATDDGGSVIEVTGVVTGRWKRVFENKVTVKDFGATGDNSTDDTAACQAAIDYCQGATPRQLYWLAGFYRVTNLTADGVVDWLGESKDTVRLISNSTGNLLTAIKSSTSAFAPINLSIQRMSFGSVSLSSTDTGHCLYIEDYIRLVIDDVTIYGAGGSGIYMTDCYVMRLNRIYGLFCGQNPAMTDEAVIRYVRVSTGNSLYITNSYISNSLNTDGIKINTIQNVSISNTTLESCNRLINIGTGGTATRSIKLDSIYCENAAISHIDLRAFRGATLSNIYVNPNGPRESTVERAIGIFGTYNDVLMDNVSITGVPADGNTAWLSPYEFNVRTGNTAGTQFVAGVEMNRCDASGMITLNDNGTRTAVNTKENHLGIKGIDLGIRKVKSQLLTSTDVSAWTATGAVSVTTNTGAFYDGADTYTVEGTTATNMGRTNSATFLEGEELCFSCFGWGSGTILLRGRRSSDNVFEDVAQFAISSNAIRRVWASATLTKEYNAFISRITPNTSVTVAYVQLEKKLLPSEWV